ncbi:MAG TPA: hypothetical protein VK025_06005 [Steroidobacter sp.]|nr:hypothetical protein [Steroidobacter sp.]
MHPNHVNRTESAIYWGAVGLIVCEGLSIGKAAERLGVDDDELRAIVHRRQKIGHAAQHRRSAETHRLRT